MAKKATRESYGAALAEFGADERIVDINGMTAMDHYNRFLEKGPSEKKYDRGNSYRKHNNGRNRW